MKLFVSCVLAASGLVAPLAAQPVQAQASSTVKYAKAADGSSTVEIRNVSYEVTGDHVPGRPAAERLLLRKTAESQEALGDIGVEATVTLEAWRLGDDLRQKPVYAVKVTGTDAHSIDNSIWVASRGVEEVEWWSVYKLGSGQHLFDTYVEPVKFSISRATVETRFAGLEIPPDDTADARLKQPNVIGVLSYTSADHVIREALLTCDDRKRAALLRSYADVTRVLSWEAGRGLKLTFSQNYPSAANPIDVLVPVSMDDLDLSHAQLPPQVHVAAWRR